MQALDRLHDKCFSKEIDRLIVSGNHTESAAAIGFATNLGAWGPLLAGYYEAARTELPGEAKFWKSLIAGNQDVLEIGAGSGFISAHLSEMRPKSLTLVEPEVENLRLLQRNFESRQLEILPIYVASKFETGTFAKQDLIVLPYDTLPMITDIGDRAQLFSLVSQTLKSQGRFALHVSTPEWNNRYIETTKEKYSRDYTLSSGLRVSVARYVKRISASEYIKFISITAKDLGLKENYVALTSIVSSDEILKAAERCSLTLINRYCDFYFNVGEGDDDIFIFERK